MDSSSILQILKPKAEKLGITNFTPTSVALSGVVNLINRNLTIGEIIKLSGFEMKKIADVADYLLIDKDISQLINKKKKTIWREASSRFIRDYYVLLFCHVGNSNSRQKI